MNMFASYFQQETYLTTTPPLATIHKQSGYKFPYPQLSMMHQICSKAALVLSQRTVIGAYMEIYKSCNKFWISSFQHNIIFQLILSLAFDIVVCFLDYKIKLEPRKIQHLLWNNKCLSNQPSQNQNIQCFYLQILNKIKDIM